MSSEHWDTALDRIEANLRAFEDALRDGGPAPDRPAVELPGQPMPGELGARAQALLAHTRALEARANGERDRIRDALRALAGRRPPAPSPTGRIVDVGA